MKKGDDNDATTFLQAFPFSLEDQTKSWLYYLSSGSITTWTRMKKLFLKKYFHASKAAAIRKETSSIEQISGQSLYDYWERYKRLLASYPHHQIPPQLIITHLYEGLLLHERHLIDAASSDALANKTIEEATSLIESMAVNTQQFYTRDSSVVRRVSEMGDSSHIEQQMGSVEKMVERIASAVIPTYDDDAEVNVIFPNQRKRQGGFQQQFRPQPQAPKEDTSEKTITMMQGLTYMFQQNQQKNDADIKELQTQMGQLATTVGKLEAQASTKLPSQSFVNPREHVNAVTLRSERQIEDSTLDTGAVRVPSNDIE
ncbi:uncharacterized protein LOC113279074 [Papaver somniferum]|uniref:uncharacterized protein LOC113279074 n=1 Tax=Papaver somniferum TaxID=3469 RepID=UPI000E6FA094|nr:uncharacterized protein LOC113279074 [Papaver somniferum]